MPRVFVMTDPGATGDGQILLNEQVASLHLSDGHTASQLIERLAWAISDAEDAEITGQRLRQTGRPVSSKRARRRGQSPARRPRTAAA